MFPLVSSKHSSDQYDAWISNFVRAIETPIYLFVPPSFATRLAPLPPHITLNTSFNSPFDIPPLRNHHAAYAAMQAKDREGFRHNADLYAIWNAKPYLLEQGLFNAQDVYDYAFWSDAGSFREQGHHYKRWPARHRIDQVWQYTKANDSTILFPFVNMPSRIDRWWTEKKGPIDRDISEGSFFGGQPNAIAWYKSVFYQYHDYYMSLGFFVGKDQTLINAIILLFPEHFIGVYYDDRHSPTYVPADYVLHHRWWRELSRWVKGYGGTRALGICNLEWFYYQFFLTYAEERTLMRAKWLNSLKYDSWDAWFGDDEDIECRMTHPIRIDEALRRQDVFGPHWNGASRSLNI